MTESRAQGFSTSASATWLLNPRPVELAHQCVKVDGLLGAERPVLAICSLSRQCSSEPVPPNPALVRTGEKHCSSFRHHSARLTLLR